MQGEAAWWGDGVGGRRRKAPACLFFSVATGKSQAHTTTLCGKLHKRGPLSSRQAPLKAGTRGMYVYIWSKKIRQGPERVGDPHVHGVARTASGHTPPLTQHESTAAPPSFLRFFPRPSLHAILRAKIGRATSVGGMHSVEQQRTYERNGVVQKLTEITGTHRTRMTR